jgi:MoaA/NifB/PqqE/SkfB family radical SAM enzyme
VELAGREKNHDLNVARQGAFRRAIEGIRAAKLSGFHVCAHVTVNENTDVCEAGELFDYLDRHDVDGFVVSSGGRAIGSPGGALEEALEDIRALVRCSRWESFSRLLEASYAARGERAAVSVAVPEGEGGAVEESA